MSESQEREPTAEEIAASVEQARAEARKFDAEAERAKAEAANFAAEERQRLAQARSFEANASAVEMELETSRELHDRQQATDSHHHVYRFIGDVNKDSMKACMDELSYWHRMDAGCPMEMVLHSPGGHVLPGLALYDFLRDMSRRGHRLTTVCSGYAGSMAGIILQAGNHRVMGRESHILVHEITAATYGKVGVIEDDVSFYRHLCDRVVDIFVSRSGGKLTKARMNKEWRGHDWWIDSKLALELGIVDEVR